jgi:flagellar biosynthetic protein FliQ
LKDEPMLTDHVITLGREALITSLLLAAAPLLVAIVVAVVMSMFQTVTQIQDPAITTVPKIVAVLVTLLICFPWLLRTMVEYVANVYTTAPMVLGAG